MQTEELKQRLARFGISMRGPRPIQRMFVCDLLPPTTLKADAVKGMGSTRELAERNAIDLARHKWQGLQLPSNAELFGLKT